MSEPFSATSATYAVATASMLTLVPGVDPAIMIGAFTGATMFVLSNESSGKIERVGLFVVSFFGGVLCANWVANAASAILPVQMSVNEGMAALISSACVVRILQYIMTITNDPESWINSIREQKRK
ncbi:MAG: putative holin [Enterovibrio sp.]